MLGGVRAELLAQRYGTPVLVIELDAVDSAIDAFLSGRGASELEVSYAAKAFATIEFFRHLARHPIGLDVCSMGELATAERAGIAPERLTLHGAGKCDDELLAARDGRVGYITVDGLEELERLAWLAGEGCRAGVILRMNLGIDAQTHAFVRTGGQDSKFGIHPRDEAAAFAVLREHRQLRFAGLHSHIGSQIFHANVYVAATAGLLDVAVRFAGSGIQTPRIVIGGGFGVATHPDEQAEELDVYGAVSAVRDVVRDGAKARGLPLPRLGIEPGRAIIARAGTTLYTVLAVKRQTARTFVVVDGGIAENPRPALYGARHEVITVAPQAEMPEEMTLCGRSCENDELGIVALPRSIRSRDLLAMRATGAYTYSMAGNYNRFPRPAVVGVSGSAHRLLARRETLDEVLARDQDLEREESRL